jgi:polysaccharide biosynthesis protein PslG
VKRLAVLALGLAFAAPAGVVAVAPSVGVGASALPVEAGALALPAKANALIVGVGDQEPYMFSDPRFQALGIRYARLTIGWNALESASQARQLATWLRDARADGVHPLIGFEQSWFRGRHKRLPTPAQLGRQFRRLRARYPWVTDFATWNEADYCGQPTCHRPGLVAAYYGQMRRICPSCNVLAAELLDEPNMVRWVHGFQHALHREPGIWGLHDYIGANRLQTASTRALLHATRGQVWLTETGGVVARHNHSATDFPESAVHAAAVTSFVFDRLVPLSGRIARVYLYQWDVGPHRRQAGPIGWDSGLIGPHGTPRPSFWVLVRELNTLGQLPATAAANALLASARGPTG